jgi:hypothetical protein
MEKIINGIKWVFKNFFFIVIGIFIITFIRASWYQLFDGVFPILIWVLVNILFATGLRIATLRSWIGWISLLVLILMFFINAFIVFIDIQTKVIASAEYNGTNYFIVEHMTWDSWESPIQLEKRCGYHMCGSYSLKGAPSMGFFYESKSNLVHVVSRYKDKERLIFTDSNPPRYYKDAADSMNHRFYNSIDCIKRTEVTYGYHCDSYRHIIYECELDNTGCVPLPFQFVSVEDYSYLEFNEATQEIVLYVIPDIGDDILVYSYGDHPRCHVEGCEILSQP